MIYSLCFNVFRDGFVDGWYGFIGVNKIFGYDGVSYENRVSIGNFEVGLEYCFLNL